MKFIALLIILICLSASGQEPDLQFSKMDGFKGIWFELGQKFEHGDKYSGGLGTYTAKHTPMAIYNEDRMRTYFVYGGTTKPDQKHLLSMISYYDHKTNRLARPVVVHDKQGVDDPHDNPSLLIDGQGYVWVFVSGRGKSRPGFKYKSHQPHQIDSFVHVSTEEMTYPQPWYLNNRYFHFFTKYTGIRELYFERSRDGIDWAEDTKLAAIKRKNDEYAGHYQTSGSFENKVGTFLTGTRMVM